MAQRSLQQNNYSPMGQGQPTSGKTGRKHPTGNFMNDTLGMDDPVMEAVAPGIPAAQIGAQMGMKSPNGFNDVAQAPRMASQQPTNNTMPVQQGTPGVPAGFQGQGTGWRGLDLTPTQVKSPNGFTGFNMDRAMAGGDPKSTKDAFARWAAGFDQNIGGLDKSPGGALEQMLRSRLDEARRMGLNIQDIQGEKILLDAYENQGQMNWVDSVKNAGAANAEWAWQPEGVPSSAPANDLYARYQSQLIAQPETSGESDLEQLLMALMSQNQEQI